MTTTNIKKQITLYSTANGSDKVYMLFLKEVAGGFVVHYTHGRREVGPFQSGTKTPDPKDKKKDLPVTLEAAEEIFADVEHEKRTGKSKYHEDDTEKSPSAMASAPTETPVSRPNVDCMELTALMDANAA